MKSFVVRSPAFSHMGTLPLRCTCDGKNVSPPLEFSGVPTHAESLALIMDDPDAPGGTWLHWTVWNIKVPRDRIRENEVPGVQGLNDFGRVNYGGPCPPTGTHRYFIRVYALDTLLNLPEGSSREQLEEAMQKHILAKGEIVGLYKRTKTLTAL